MNRLKLYLWQPFQYMPELQLIGKRHSEDPGSNPARISSLFLSSYKRESYLTVDETPKWYCLLLHPLHTENTRRKMNRRNRWWTNDFSRERQRDYSRTQVSLTASTLGFSQLYRNVPKRQLRVHMKRSVRQITTVVEWSMNQPNDILSNRNMYVHTINEPHLLKARPRCCTKSYTAQDVFQPIPGLISYARTTRR